MNFLILVSLIWPISSILTADPLYTITEGSVKTEKVCKRNKDALSCRKIKINFDLIESKADILIPEVDAELSFESLTMETKRDRVFEYENGVGDSAVLDISKKKVTRKDKKNKKKPSYLVASIHAKGRVFEIDPCKKRRQRRCHVLIELDPSKFIDEVGIEPSWNMPEVLPGSTRHGSFVNAKMERSSPMLQVKIYYTQTLLDSFENVDEFNAFINLVFSETNIGYSKSGVNLQAQLHSTELSTLPDRQNMTTLWLAFRSSKENNCLLRDGADAAVLLILDGDRCGIASFNSIQTGETLGVVQKSCATGYYSFGHEIAHMAGAYHNKERYISPIPAGLYSFGELIENSSGQASGYRTIMAYNKLGYVTRINRYSSSTNTFNGNPLGTSTEDNSRQLNENAASFAAVGETVTCSSSCQDLGYNGYYCWQYTPESCNVSWFATNYCPVHCKKC